jgi:hypothetical protein
VARELSWMAEEPAGPFARARGVYMCRPGRHLVYRTLRQLNSMERSLLDRSLDPVDGRVETALVDLQSRLLGLADLLDDLLVVGAQLTVTVGLLLDDRPDAVVLAGVGCDICQDAQLGQVRVVFRVDAFELWMEGGVAGAGQAGIALVDLGVGISLLEVDEMVFSWERGVYGAWVPFRCTLIYLRYIK